MCHGDETASRGVPGHRCLYLEGLGDPGLRGLVDLCLPDSPAATLAQLSETEAQVLLVGIIFNLQTDGHSQSERFSL